jgi:hypothetical protein
MNIKLYILDKRLKIENYAKSCSPSIFNMHTASHMRGAKLEVDVFSALKSLDIFDAVYHERELVDKFGWQCCSIDVLAVCGDYIIPTQQKWRMSKRRETQDVNNFIKSMEYIQGKLGKKILFGVWSSRKHPFDDNALKLKEWNVFCISHFSDIDGLVQKTIEVVKHEFKCV